MKAPEIPENEVSRLKVLHELLILDTPPEDRFDVITQYCASRFNVPVAVVSLVDSERQWFKSVVGLNATETSREVSFCGHAILQEKIFEVNDAKTDDRFHDNPLVQNDPKIRFYAGTPLVIKGQNIGTLCIIDSKPHSLEDTDRKALEDLGKMVCQEILRKENEKTG